MEACGGANYWGREFVKHGHNVKMMPPQYVKPYVKTNKNDYNDAEAICEAVQRPNMHFVPKKSVEQQDIQMLHRIRQRLIGGRTALVNEARGLLMEYGIIVGKGVSRFQSALVEIIGKVTNKGTRTVKLAELTCIFYDPYNQVVLRERVGIVREKTGSLAPGETKPFRMAFDSLPPFWNQSMPQLVIAQIQFE